MYIKQYFHRHATWAKRTSQSYHRMSLGVNTLANRNRLSSCTVVRLKGFAGRTGTMYFNFTTKKAWYFIVTIEARDPISNDIH